LITPIDTGRANSSSGVLVYIDATRAGLLHRNDRVGEVVVHFPRFGYHVNRFGEANIYPTYPTSRKPLNSNRREFQAGTDGLDQDYAPWLTSTYDGFH